MMSRPILSTLSHHFIDNEIFTHVYGFVNFVKLQSMSKWSNHKGSIIRSGLAKTELSNKDDHYKPDNYYS